MLLCSGPLVVVALAIIPRHEDVLVYSDKTTHVQLAERTVELVASDSSYQELKRFAEIIAKADSAEDAGDRGDNHFFDPTSGGGLAMSSWVRVFGKLVLGPGRRRTEESFPHYISAFEWAKDKMGIGTGLDGKGKELDWKGAIEAYDYTADAKRDAYEAVGHVLHLLQDMGQPDHVALRPHPCNYIRASLGKFGKLLFPDRAGYESLWERENKSWPKGTKPVPVTSLDRAFRDLASESRQAERDKGLPRWLKSTTTSAGNNTSSLFPLCR